MKTSKRLFYALAAVVCLVANQSRADVVFDSLTTTTPGGHYGPDEVNAYQPLAQSFVMTHSTATLLDVVLNMDVPNGTGSTFAVSLYDNLGGVPGASLASLTGNTPSTAGLYTYVPSGTVSLVQGSTYWVVASSTAMPDEGYKWMLGQGIPLVGTEIGMATDWGEGWVVYNINRPMEMQVNAVPEAAVMLTNGAILLAVGLGWWYYRRQALPVA
jgi:hypothetical protein